MWNKITAAMKGFGKQMLAEDIDNVGSFSAEESKNPFNSWTSGLFLLYMGEILETIDMFKPLDSFFKKKQINEMKKKYAKQKNSQVNQQSTRRRRRRFNT